MALSKLYNLARMTAATTGMGTITLGSAVSGFLTFAVAGVQNGETVSYGIKDGPIVKSAPELIPPRNNADTIRNKIDQQSLSR